MKDLELPDNYSIVINNTDETIKLKVGKVKALGRRLPSNGKQLVETIDEFKQFAIDLNKRMQQRSFAEKLLKELPI
jgi:hypothetical protein